MDKNKCANDWLLIICELKFMFWPRSDFLHINVFVFPLRYLLFAEVLEVGVVEVHEGVLATSSRCTIEVLVKAL